MRRGSSAEEAVEVAQVVAERRRRGGGGDRHDEGHPLARFPIAPARPQREARAEHDGGADEQAVEGDHRGSGLGTRDSRNPTWPPCPGPSESTGPEGTRWTRGRGAWRAPWWWRASSRPTPPCRRAPAPAPRRNTMPRLRQAAWATGSREGAPSRTAAPCDRCAARPRPRPTP